MHREIGLTITETIKISETFVIGNSIYLNMLLYTNQTVASVDLANGSGWRPGWHIVIVSLLSISNLGLSAS